MDDTLFNAKSSKLTLPQVCDQLKKPEKPSQKGWLLRFFRVCFITAHLLFGWQ